VSDLLRVDDVEVDCVIGVYAEERTTSQPLRVSLALVLDAARAARSGHLDDTVDYARLFGQLRFVLVHGAFQLIETAAESLCAVVLRAAPAVDDVTLTLAKPRALAGNGLPSLTLTRRRARSTSGDDNVAVEIAVDVAVTVVWSGPDASVHHVVVGPGLHVRVPAQAAVLDVDAGRQGEPVPHDGSITVAHDARARRLLVVARPAVGDDAIVVERR